MRHLLGALGGAVLALVLLTLLALLVAPPVDPRPEIQPPMTVALVEAPQQQVPSSEPAPEQAAPRPPAAMPSPPPPAAIPSPSPTQPIAVPTPDLPSPRAPALPLDRRLPELTTQQPEPQPEPQPKPASKPEPEPTSRVAEAPAGDSAPKDASQTPAANHGVVNSPRPTRRVPPTYPARAQRRGIEGYVEVRFTIRPDGSVDRDSLRVVDAEPRNVFDRAALKAIADWQFPRASRPREARQRLVFKLRG